MIVHIVKEKLKAGDINSLNLLVYFKMYSVENSDVFLI